MTDAANRLASVSASAPELRDSVLTTARTIFTSWAHPDIAHAVDVHAGQSGPDILHVRDLIHSADTLYLVTSASEQQLFAPVFETLVNVVYREVEEAYAANGSHPLDPPLLLALDEAGNVAPIKRPPEIASAGGGQGCLLESVWQDEGQIVARYGREQAAVVMSNHWGRVYMPGISDERSLRALSELIGRDEMQAVSWSTDTWGSYDDVTVVPRG
ncbi:TraM recognition domain-containing protein [Cutibacterium avidum]|uniref:TraM recognition domain-containing protein n=1 Tax=Cutibacterium avidum TaxID=33010 RepID=UPI003367E546